MLHHFKECKVYAYWIANNFDHIKWNSKPILFPFIKPTEVTREGQEAAPGPPLCYSGRNVMNLSDPPRCFLLNDTYLPVASKRAGWFVWEFLWPSNVKEKACLIILNGALDKAQLLSASAMVSAQWWNDTVFPWTETVLGLEFQPHVAQAHWPSLPFMKPGWERSTALLERRPRLVIW